jgi:O-antigen/teichoic acid export membrane protein
LIVIGTAAAANPAIRVAFGAKYLDGAGSFELASAAWLFALAGATQALIQLALLDAVARRSAAIGWIVFAGIVAETVVILTVAHHSAVELIGTAAVCGSATAVVSLTVTAFAKHRASALLPNQPASEYAAATS